VFTGIVLEEGERFDKSALHARLAEWNKKSRQKDGDEYQQDPSVFHLSAFLIVF
jgi:hypothetical protein